MGDVVVFRETGPTDGHERTNRHDRGAVVFVVAVVVVFGAVAMLVVAELTLVGVEASRARTAADAAALAAVERGPSDAHRIAAANGATVVAVHMGPDTAEVTVRVGRATARARATNGP